MSNKQIIAYANSGDEVGKAPNHDEIMAFALANNLVLPAEEPVVEAKQEEKDPFEFEEEETEPTDVVVDEIEEAKSVAFHQLIAINEILDRVSPGDDDDLDTVERFNQFVDKVTVGAKPGSGFQPLASTCDLEVPAPIMAAMLGQMMRRGFGDMRYHHTPSTLTAGGCKWEISYREGSFVIQRTSNWEEVSEANHEWIGMPSRRAETFRAMEGAKDHFDRLTKQAGASTAPTKRVVGHRETVDDKGNKKMEPILVEQEVKTPRSVTTAQNAIPDARKRYQEAKKEYDAVMARHKWAKKLIESSMPEDFQFSLADIASGAVRITDKW